MRYKVLKDVKVMIGFISSIVLSCIAIVLAVNDIRFWVFFIVVSMVVLFFSVHRAGKIMTG